MAGLTFLVDPERVHGYADALIEQAAQEGQTNLVNMITGTLLAAGTLSMILRGSTEPKYDEQMQVMIGKFWEGELTRVTGTTRDIAVELYEKFVHTILLLYQQESTMLH